MSTTCRLVQYLSLLMPGAEILYRHASTRRRRRSSSGQKFGASATVAAYRRVSNTANLPARGSQTQR